MSTFLATSSIQLGRMPQLAEAVNLEDDWTGVTSAALRRKRQNRLNVRAYRRRKAQELQSKEINVTSTSDIKSNSVPGVPCWIEDQQAVLHLPNSVVKAFNNSSTPLLPMTPNPTRLDRVILPLSSDHLIILLQYNVLRGCMINRQLLLQLSPNISADDEFSSTELVTSPEMDASSAQCLPSSLHPTTLQRTKPHQAWIDIIPHPTLRDNLILASGTFDEDELWSDTVGGLFEGFPDSEIEKRGVYVWSPPWHVSGWEISEGFYRKWGWSLEGCSDLLETTNLRRKERGDEPLLFEA